MQSNKIERSSVNSQWSNVQRGFSLVEVLLAGSIFILLVTAISAALIYGQESTALSGQRARAVFLAEEGLEAVRNIRDEDYANIPADNNYGLSVVANKWSLTGSSDVTDIFTRQINISTIDADRKQISSIVTWSQNEQRTGSISLVTYLANWGVAVSGGGSSGGDADDLVIDVSNAEIKKKDLKKITLENIGSSDITIDKITVTWTDTGRKIQQVKIDGTKVWDKNGPGTPSGKQISGTELDIQDFILNQGSGVIDIDKFKFDGNMPGNTFSIIFEMSDGSTATVSGISP